jgi:hypothetical protein
MILYVKNASHDQTFLLITYLISFLASNDAQIASKTTIKNLFSNLQPVNYNDYLCRLPILSSDNSL